MIECFELLIYGCGVDLQDLQPERLSLLSQSVLRRPEQGLLEYLVLQQLVEVLAQQQNGSQSQVIVYESDGHAYHLHLV